MTGATLSGSRPEVALPEGTPVLLKPFCLTDLRNQVALAVGQGGPR